jgi:hypothetical protein
MKARIKTGEPLYNNLTVGKWYSIKEISVETTPHVGKSFEIDDDVGMNCFCLQLYCSWINNGSWEISN